jgi:hypothetical protein
MIRPICNLSRLAFGGASRIAGLNALFTSAPLRLDLLGWRFRATRVESFLQTEVVDDSLDAPNANECLAPVIRPEGARNLDVSNLWPEVANRA